jgi:preprotein translocase subunit SecE
VRPGTPSRPPAKTGAAERAARAADAERFVRDLASEMRRVTWPSRQEWVSATVLTVALVAVIGLYTYVLDEFFGFVIGLVHH